LNWDEKDGKRKLNLLTRLYDYAPGVSRRKTTVCTPRISFSKLILRGFFALEKTFVFICLRLFLIVWFRPQKPSSTRCIFAHWLYSEKFLVQFLATFFTLFSSLFLTNWCETFEIAKKIPKFSANTDNAFLCSVSFMRKEKLKILYVTKAKRLEQKIENKTLYVT
jgi:hypothetical protein